MIVQPSNVPVRREQRVGYELSEPWSYYWTDPEGHRRFIRIPRGFFCDGMSIPRLLWTVSGITPDGLSRAASTLHDFICDHKGKLPAGTYYRMVDGYYQEFHTQHIWTRKENDRLFGRVLKESDYSKFKRRLAYRAVRSYSKWSGEW